MTKIANIGGKLEKFPVRFVQYPLYMRMPDGSVWMRRGCQHIRMKKDGKGHWVGAMHDMIDFDPAEEVIVLKDRS